MKRPKHRIHALLPSSAIAIALALAGCPKEDAGGFGDAKPTTNDGMVRKPAEPVQGPPDFQNALVVSPSFDKATGKLTVSLDIKPGFHAYAPGEEVGKPVELKVDAQNGWMIDGAVAIPAGVTKDLGELGKSVILEGKVDLGATVKGGTGELAGTVTVQVCTDKACDRPKPHAFRVPTA